MDLTYLARKFLLILYNDSAKINPLHAILNSTTATASTVIRNLSPISTKLTSILKPTDPLSVVLISNVYTRVSPLEDGCTTETCRE
jgi:hypothetical protein